MTQQHSTSGRRATKGKNYAHRLKVRQKQDKNKTKTRHPF